MCMLADAAPHLLVGGLRGPQVPDVVLATGRGRQPALLVQFFVLIISRNNWSSCRHLEAGIFTCQQGADELLGGDGSPPLHLPRHRQSIAVKQLHGHAHRAPWQQQSATQGATPALRSSLDASCSAPPPPFLAINGCATISFSSSTQWHARSTAISAVAHVKLRSRSVASVCCSVQLADACSGPQYAAFSRRVMPRGCAALSQMSCTGWCTESMASTTQVVAGWCEASAMHHQYWTAGGATLLPPHGQLGALPHAELCTVELRPLASCCLHSSCDVISHTSIVGLSSDYLDIHSMSPATELHGHWSESR